jgi:hypothetical protein
MKEFFIHADLDLWKRFLGPGFYDNLLKTQDNINRVMNVIDEYYNYRLTNETDVFARKDARLGLVRSLLLTENLLSQVRVDWYDHLLDVLWHSLKPATVDVQNQYSIHFVGAVYQNDVFLGLTGEGFEKSKLETN